MRKFPNSFSTRPTYLNKQPSIVKDNTFNILHQQRGWPADAIPSFGELNNAEIENDNLLYEGFCIDLLREMAKLLNFTYELVEVVDGAYGVEVSRILSHSFNIFSLQKDEYGHWNGIIGVLQRHEADLSVSALTITYSRISVVGN